MGSVRRGAALLLTTSVAAGCATEAAPCGACRVAPPSTLFVSDRGADQVLRYDGATGAFVDVFASAADRVDRPAGLQLGPSGHVYLAGFGRGDVVRHDPMSGAVHDVFYADTTLLEEPLDLVFRRDAAAARDELLVLGNDTGNVVVLDAAGRAVRELGYPAMRGATDLALAPDEATLLVGVPGGVQRWDLATGALLATFGGEALAAATSLALRDDGTLYVADWDRGSVLRFLPEGALLDVVVGAGGLAGPVALELGPDGALYVLDDAGLHRLDPDTGSALGLRVAARDGHNVRPRAFRFVTQTALAQAIARTR